MKTKLIFNIFLFLLVTNFVYSQNLIIGEWKKTDTCPDGNSIIQNFKDDGTGTVIVPDCNKVCAPYYYKYEFLWSTRGSKLTVNYKSVAEYCGKKAPVPPTDVMDYEVSENNLRIVQDRYVRTGTQNSSTNAKVEFANKISEEYNLAPEHSELLQIIASSNSKEELLSKLKAKNQELYTETAMKAVNKLFENTNIDLPISISEMTQIANGNYEGAVDNMNRNRLTNELSDVFGGNSEIASTLSNGLYNLASSIGEERWENEVKVGKEILNQINLFNSNYISFKKPKTNINFSDESNFGNKNWKLTQNEFFNSKKVDNNTIEVSFKNNPSLNSLRNNDIHFAELDLKNFDVTQNFDITFEIGYPTESKTLNNVVLNAPFIGLYISETNLFEAHPISANFKYNFTPLLNKYTSFGESGMSYISQEYKDFYFSHIKLGKSTFDLSDYKQVRKKEKSLIKIYKKINKDYNQDFYFVKYRIVKENDKAKIQLFYPNENMEMNELHYDSEYFDFKFKNTNKIYFGATYGVNLLNGSIAYPKVEKIRIRNFIFK